MAAELNKNGSQYYLNCTDLNITQLNRMNLSRGATAAVCTVILITMLTTLCFSKAYTSTMQRLFSYLVLATTVCEACVLATVEHQFYYTHQDKVCTALGFVTHWSSMVVILCALGVTLFAIVLVCAHRSNVTLSRWWRVLLETLYISSAVLLPLSITWYPLVHDHYGLAVAWCWIRAFDESCDAIGLTEQLLLGYGTSAVVGLVGIIATIGLATAYCKISSEFVQVKQLLVQSLLLSLSVLLYILVSSSALAIRIYSGVTGWTRPYGMWIFHGVMFPVVQLIIPLGFLGTFYFQDRCCKQHVRRADYDRLEAAKETTVPVSCRESITSTGITFSDSGFTNAYTEFGKQVSDSLRY